MLADGRRGRAEKRRQQENMGFFLNICLVRKIKESRLLTGTLRHE
jgi:hypothetical protein